MLFEWGLLQKAPLGRCFGNAMGMQYNVQLNVERNTAAKVWT
jgi:hypothetical protein